MKYKFTISILFLLSSLVYGQDQDRIYYNQEGKGVDNSAQANYYRLLSPVVPGSPIDSVHDYYVTGEIKLKGTSPNVNRDDDRETIWIGRKLIYFKSGKLMADDFFNRDGKMDSVSTRYYESGKMRQLIVSKNGAVVDKFYKEWDEFDRCEKVFSDQFHYSNNKNNWPLNENDRHECKIIKDEGLEMTTFGDNGVMQSLELPLDLRKNYSIESVVELESGDISLWHGLVWGFKDWDNYFFYYINADGHFRIGYVTQGIVNFYVKNDISSAIWTGRGVTNQMKIIVSKGTAYYSVNGRVVYQVHAYDFAGNHIGFFIPQGKQQVLYHNIMVRQDMDENSGYSGPGGSSAGSGNAEFKGWKGNGSGFFIDARGYIVTNYHVIATTTEIEVDATQDGERHFFKAIVVSSDKQNDLALLKITDDKFTPYHSLPYNLKTTVADVATSVFALGFPEASIMGTEVKFTDGKISSKTGVNNNPETYQITVPVQPGNSGGPLFDDSGNIIGIVNAKIESVAVSNVAYAIKSGYLKNFLDALSEKLVLPHDPSLAGKALTEKIKILTDYVVLIKVK